MKFIAYLSAICAFAVTAAIGVTYLVMVALASFVTWSPVLWSLADWHPVGRFFLLGAAVFWVCVGIETFRDELRKVKS